MNGYCKKDFQEARWCEPIVMELGQRGQRGVSVPPAASEALAATQNKTLLPDCLKRRRPPALPELSQMQVVRHFTRLSQEILGTDINIDIGLGTCTMKYSPKIHEQFVRSEKLSELHPYQDESTVQGVLEIIYRLSEYLKAISGLDCVSLQPSGGSQAVFANVEVLKAYLKSKGQQDQRTEIITTMLSHPCNPGAAATLGFTVKTLMPGEDGLPSLDELKGLLSEKTAALMITNPEDTGIYNRNIKAFVDAVHEAGGLCIYDQANLNGLFGITRAREAGFDMCSYNLHKSFSSPHGCQGPGTGAQCVRDFLAPFVAGPVVTFDGSSYHLEDNGPQSIGKLRKFYGIPAVCVRAYSYIRSLGAGGLKEVAELAILNNNYMLKKMSDIPGLELPWSENGTLRLEQARLSFKKLTQETGVTTDDIARRIVDYGFQDFFTSHLPRVVEEPFTPEPAETYAKADIDEYVEAIRSVVREAYENPELVKGAPYKAALSDKIDPEGLTRWDKFATTWRAYLKYVAKRNPDDAR